MALLSAILVFMFSVVEIMREAVTPQVVVQEKKPKKTTDEPVEEEELEVDDTVPIEQFTPDFTKPIVFKEDIDTSIKAEE